MLGDKRLDRLELGHTLDIMLGVVNQSAAIIRALPDDVIDQVLYDRVEALDSQARQLRALVELRDIDGQMGVAQAALVKLNKARQDAQDTLMDLAGSFPVEYPMAKSPVVKYGPDRRVSDETRNPPEPPAGPRLVGP